MAILLLRRFGCEVPIPAHFGEFFLEIWPLNVVGYCHDPQKAHPWPETRVMAYIDRSDRSRNATWARDEESKKRKKRNSEIWQVTHLPRPPTWCYPHQSFHVEWGPEHSQPCQVSSKLFKGFWLPEGSKSAFSLYLALWLIQQVRFSAQPVTNHPSI